MDKPAEMPAFFVVIRHGALPFFRKRIDLISRFDDERLSSKFYN